jgi:hypothetical protein
MGKWTLEVRLRNEPHLPRLAISEEDRGKSPAAAILT